MTPIAPHMSAFLREHLPQQKGASANTCESYAYAFRLLFEFASKRFQVTPSALELEQIDAPLIIEFLRYLETERHNCPSTRNARLVAIKSFMHFVEYRVPALLEQSRRILTIPTKRTETRLVNWLSRNEMQAILNIPDPQRRGGIRDRAMMHLCFAAGLRVSELVGLPLTAVEFQPVAQVQVRGKGRKERALPLWKQTAIDLRAWLSVRGEARVPELFLNARGMPMTRFGFEYVLHKHVQTAAQSCASLQKKHVSPHVLRHTSAMLVLQATGDIRKVSLWLGHANIRTTEIYLRADPTEKLEAIESSLPLTLRRGQFRAPDRLIASLRGDG